MNKTRKHLTASTSSDAFMLSENKTKLEVNAGEIPHVSAPAHDISTIWKPYTVDGYSEQEAGNWNSLTYDLLHSFDQMAKLFRFELLHKSWLNAYLLAAGMNQIVEDYLHTNYIFLLKIAKYLGKLPSPLGALLVRGNRYFNDLWTFLNEKNKSSGKIIRWQHKLAELLNRLAEVVIEANPPKEMAINQIMAEGGSITAYVPYFPISLRDSIIKLPSCFRSFDQRPEDIRRIVEEFSIHWPERERLIMVLGVRTSGSYLAPLYAAFLREMGYTDVQVLTIRPGTPLLRSELKVICELIEKNGLALLCDDPPLSGSTLSKSARLLEEAEIPRRNIVLMLQLFGNYDSLPDSLQQYPSVLLSWPNWSIHRYLELNNVRAALTDACDPSYQISELERLPILESASEREHVRASYRLNLVNSTTGETLTINVQVEGAGLGYFGEHALAVAQRLPDYSARVISMQDGVLYQEIPAGSQAISASKLIDREELINHLVVYIVVRNQQLPTASDTSVKLRGRQAVWEIASILLSTSFGPAALPARLALIDSYVKKQLTAIHPSIIDGDMSLRHWYFHKEAEKPFVKTYLADRDFSHLDLWCYDPVFDLAGLALEVDPYVQPSTVRNLYESESDTKVLPENWMLYQLVQLWNNDRLDAEESSVVSRRMTQVVQRYFSEIYFQDLDHVSEGPVCAIDIDGVLESKVLGFPSLSPASARSLRALNLHGNRVILATGRSIDELKERCAAYKLNGGIAEYGAVLFDQASLQIKVLLTEEEQAILYKIRSRIANKPGIYLDNDYRFAVRAYCLDENRKQTHVDNESVEEILLETDTVDQVYAIQGLAQTDFMVKRIDKSYGLREWLVNYDRSSQYQSGAHREGKPLALAVGDSATDLPMLNLADYANAPANASWEVKQSEIPITSGPYQRGLEQAVTKYLGHRPGSCSSCAIKEFHAQTAFMQDIFAVQENGYLSMLWQAIKLLVMSGGHFHVST